MSTGPRIAPPSLPDGRIVVQPPPELVPNEGGSGILTSLLPMLGSVGAIVMVTISNSGPTGFLIGGMFLLSSLGFVAVNGWRQRAQRNAQVLGNRREYLAYLSDLRDTVRVAARKQRRHGGWIMPAPAALPFIAEERSRVWERQPGDPTFLLARIGVADQPLSLTLEAPELPPLAQLDPVAASAAHRFMLTHEIQRDLPLGFPSPTTRGSSSSAPTTRARAAWHVPSWRPRRPCTTPRTWSSRCSRGLRRRPPGTGSSGCRTRCRRACRTDWAPRG